MNLVSVITLPNGVEVEMPLVQSNRACTLCGEPSVRLELPAYQDLPAVTVDNLCGEHLRKAIDVLNEVAE